MKKIRITLLGAISMALAAPLALAGDVAKVTIKGNDQMQYDVKTFDVVAGQKVELTFKNIGVLPKEAMGHNVVVLKAGTDIPKFAMAGATQRENDFLPAEKELLDQIIAKTKILGPGESETVTFTAPSAGTYDYICTFPGHFGVMRGTMVVKEK